MPLSGNADARQRQLANLRSPKKGEHRKPPVPSLPRYERKLLVRLQESGQAPNTSLPLWSGYVATARDLEYRVKSPLDRARLMTALITAEDRLAINVHQGREEDGVQPGWKTDPQHRRTFFILAGQTGQVGVDVAEALSHLDPNSPLPTAVGESNDTELVYEEVDDELKEDE